MSDKESPHCREHDSYQHKCVMCQAFWLRDKINKIEKDHRDWEKRNFGMPALRDQFAMSALTAFGLPTNFEHKNLSQAANYAYQLADAMMGARTSSKQVDEDETRV